MSDASDSLLFELSPSFDGGFFGIARRNASMMSIGRRGERASTPRGDLFRVRVQQQRDRPVAVLTDGSLRHLGHN